MLRLMSCCGRHLPPAYSELWLPCLHVAECSSRHTALVMKQAVSAFRARPATTYLCTQQPEN